MAKLSPGDTAPDFNLSDQFGNSVKLSDYKGKKLLLYFYPKANTGGCTTQSVSVSGALKALKKKRVAAVGISLDSPAVQKKFDDKHQLGFPLLSDPEHSAADDYGVWGEKSMYGKKYMGIVRSSFLIDEKGKIEKAWYKISPKKTVPEAMGALE